MDLSQGSYIEFNSDPEDEENPELHINFGQIMSHNSDQIRVKYQENEHISTYFLDEIEILRIDENEDDIFYEQQSDILDERVADKNAKESDYIENNQNQHALVMKDECRVQDDVEMLNTETVNNNTSQINRFNLDDSFEEKQQIEDSKTKMEKLLTLRRILKTNQIEQPYWWETSKYNDTEQVVINWDSYKPICNEIIVKFYRELDDTAIDVVSDIQIQSIQNLKLWQMYQNYRQMTIMNYDNR